MRIRSPGVRSYKNIAHSFFDLLIMSHFKFPSALSLQNAKEAASISETASYYRLKKFFYLVSGAGLFGGVNPFFFSRSLISFIARSN